MNICTPLRSTGLLLASLTLGAAALLFPAAAHAQNTPPNPSPAGLPSAASAKEGSPPSSIYPPESTNPEAAFLDKKKDLAGNNVALVKATGHISNYDESRVGNYTLPDPLLLNNGQPVTNATTWFDQRRPEILEAYESQIYGRVPPTAPKVKWEVTNPGAPALDGQAICQQVTGHIGDDPNGPAIHLVIYLPAHASGPVPIWIHILFGNPPLPPGLTSTVATSPSATNPRPNRPPSAPESGPIPQILAHGYAYATFRYTEIQQDTATGTGVRQLALAPNQTTPAPDDWGGISAWAWGISRVIDYFETDPAIDPHRIAIAGHSRLGKTVLWAGAQDPRVALVYSSCGGELGSSLARRDYGETVDDMAQNFPWQFAGNFQKYAGHWNDMPVDTHMLISLIAPRPVFIVGGVGDQWSDPRGEFLGEVAAGPVYTLLGKKDLGTTRFPNVDIPLLTGSLGYLYHSGAHTMPATDWFAALEFADQHLKPPPPPTPDPAKN